MWPWIDVHITYVHKDPLNCNLLKKIGRSVPQANPEAAMGIKCSQLYFPIFGI